MSGSLKSLATLDKQDYLMLRRKSVLGNCLLHVSISPLVLLNNLIYFLNCWNMTLHY